METQPQQGSAPSLRGLKALVGILSVLIVLGTALVIGVIIHRIYAKPQAASITAPLPGAVPMANVPAQAAASLRPGERVAGIAGAGSDVAVWVTGPAGDRVLLIDPATKTVSEALAAAK